MGARTLRLWVAATEQARQYGLMNRKSMPDDRGMVFVFRTEQPLEFWMKNTLIPLDLVFVDARGKVVSIKQGKPLEVQEKIRSDAPARYAIELNAGVAAAAGVKVGDVLALPPAARDPAGLE